MKALKIVLIVIGFITVVLVLGIAIFINSASNDVKEKVFRGTPFEETGISREVYVKCEITEARRNLMKTKWVIGGRLFCTSDKQNYTHQTVKFKFSDFDEVRTFSFRLNGSQTLARPFQVRLEGHNNAQFYGAEVVDAS